MIKIEQFKLKQSIREEKLKPFMIKFTDLNYIVGENGSGKSTLLALLQNEKFEQNNKEMKLIKTEESVRTMMFDTEKDNPINKREIESVHDIALRWCSHGERMFAILNNVKENNVVLFIDEPESGLSISKRIQLAETFKKSSKDNQLIISTHCSYLIQSVEKVYDMTRKRWIHSQSFIEQQENIYGK